MSDGEWKVGLWVEIAPNITQDELRKLVAGVASMDGVVEVMGMEVELDPEEDEGESDMNLVDRTGTLQ